jgi:hypothetical protein
MSLKFWKKLFRQTDEVPGSARLAVSQLVARIRTVKTTKKQ